MRNKPIIFRNIMSIAGVSLLLTGCFDNNYDLSDIDTTIGVSVNDLVIPINVDKVSLKSIFDIDENDPDSKVKVVNGEYAFVEDGTFESSSIDIKAVKFPSPTINATEQALTFGNVTAVPGMTFSDILLDISGRSTSFNAKAENVSKNILSIESIGTDFSLSVNMSLPLNGVLKRTRIQDLKLQLPKGLIIKGENASKYDKSTGILTLGDLTQQGCGISFEISIAGIDCTADGANVTQDLAVNHSLRFSDNLSVVSGKLAVSSDDITAGATLPSSAKLTISYTMSDIVVTDFTGEMNYELEGINIDGVELNDLPDVLAQSGTDLKIANPQIYFTVSNPLHEYGVKARTGFNIASFNEDGQLINNYGLDAPGYFEIAGVPGKTDYSYYLSPAAVSSYYPGYSNPQHVGYRSLVDVLSGNGIPASLSISLDNAMLPTQKVTALPIGKAGGYGKVEGNYTFYAPLAFGEGTKIVYSRTEDGWGSDDLESLVIESLGISLRLTTNIPLDIDFTGYPIDKYGNRINNVEITGAHIRGSRSGAMETQDVNIHITGDVTGLDGISFEAVVSVGSGSAVLKPGMEIELSEIRPCIGGHYVKEL